MFQKYVFFQAIPLQADTENDWGERVSTQAVLLKM